MPSRAAATLPACRCPARGLALVAALLAAALVPVALGGCGPDASGAGTAATATQPADERDPEPGGPRPGRRAARPVRLTIAASGDLLIHSPIWQRAQQLAPGGGYDFAPLLRYLKPYVARADLALCHVETPISPAPPALARAIRQTGWDACDTASNHSLDKGQWGIAATAAALDRAGIRHTGSFAKPAGRERTLMLRAKGVRGRRARVQHVSYVPTWVRHPDYAVLPVGDALRRGLADPAALRASYARTVAVAGRARGVTLVPARLP